MTVLKTHIALNVTNIKKSIAFYQAMFGIIPVKHKVDYAKDEYAFALSHDGCSR